MLCAVPFIWDETVKCQKVRSNSAPVPPPHHFFPIIMCLLHWLTRNTGIVLYVTLCVLNQNAVSINHPLNEFVPAVI